MVQDVEMCGNLTVKGILRHAIETRQTRLNIIDPWVFEPTAVMLYETRFRPITHCVDENESDDYEPVFDARESNIFNIDNKYVTDI